MSKKQGTNKPRSLRHQQLMDTFADRLKKARKRRYKSAESFAHILKASPHAYRKYERGESEPNFETIDLICELLDLTPNDLFPHSTKRRRRAHDGNDTTSP